LVLILEVARDELRDSQDELMAGAEKLLHTMDLTITTSAKEF
jgi:hypothetical protein